MTHHASRVTLDRVVGLFIRVAICYTTGIHGTGKRGFTMSSGRLAEGALLNNRYAIEEVVGRGGMGVVYRAQDSRLDSQVAVKEMRERDLSDEDRETAVLQFEREAKLLAQLRHGNLPRVTDYFVEGDHCYLVMEFVVGKTLDSLLQASQGQPLPLEYVLDWAVQLAEVLSYLHSQDPPIVFRDLKPANIMLQQDGTVKLIDFGIARRFHEGATKDTLLYGSPGYSPPEQYGRAQTDPRSDIYALGATLHHLATGRDPASTPFKFPSARSVNPEVPPSLDAFLARCLEMEEQKRVQNAAEARSILLAIRTELAASSARAIARPLGPGARSTGKTGPPTGPKVVSSRILRAEEARTTRRLALGIAALALAVGAVAVGSRVLSRPTKPAAATSVPAKSAAVTPPAPAPSQQPEGPDEPAVEQKTASVRIVSNPTGATVFLDGKEIGQTPVEQANLPPGRHSLRLVPRPDSGFAEAAREFELEAGQNKEIETVLQQTASGESPAGQADPANVHRLDAELVPLGYRGRPGVRVSVGFRATGLVGKEGLVGVFFYASDGVTPLQPGTPTPGFQNVEGQLSVSQPFRVSADPEDFPEVSLTLPANAFPVELSQVTFRAVVYVGGRTVGRSVLRPLLSNGTPEAPR
jgi:tRNA A-37 threonylcarbamoyl transferase component Bud32